MSLTINESKIYITIPSKYSYVYEQLLKRMSDFGTALLDDCSSNCKNSNKQTVICWNMFQAACAAYQREEVKKAELLINYICACLNIEFTEYEFYYTYTDLPQEYEDDVEQYISNDFTNQCDAFEVSSETFDFITDIVTKEYFMFAIPVDSWKIKDNKAIVNDDIEDIVYFTKAETTIVTVDGKYYNVYYMKTSSLNNIYKFTLIK